MIKKVEEKMLKMATKAKSFNEFATKLFLSDIPSGAIMNVLDGMSLYDWFEKTQSRQDDEITEWLSMLYACNRLN